MDCNKLMESMSLTENISSPSFYKSICASIDGVETEVVYADHSNSTLIIVSQYQKLGSLLIVTKDQIENLESAAEIVYTVKPVSGKENPEEQAAARFIAEQIDTDNKLCMFLCLKKYEPEIVKAVVDVLLNLKNNLI